MARTADMGVWTGFGCTGCCEKYVRWLWEGGRGGMRKGWAAGQFSPHLDVCSGTLDLHLNLAFQEGRFVREGR